MNKLKIENQLDLIEQRVIELLKEHNQLKEENATLRKNTPINLLKSQIHNPLYKEKGDEK